MRKKVLIISLILFLVDYTSKFLIFKFFDMNIKNYLIGNFFAIYPIKNYGAAFSIFNGSNIFLILISIVILGYLLITINKQNDTFINRLSYGLLIGGLIGNLFDRIWFKYVRDFISLTIFGYDFAVFNVADVAIVIGVIFLIIFNVLREKKNEVNS